MSDVECSDNDDHPSDATILLAEEVSQQFKKAFPLKKETEKKLQMAKNRYTPAVCKKLNFDETLSPILQLQTECKSVKASRDSSERMRAIQQKEIETLKTQLEEKAMKITLLMGEKAAMRERQLEMKQQCYEQEENLNKACIEVNIKCDNAMKVAEKYYTWFKMAEAQLMEIQQHVSNNSKWDDESQLQAINNTPMEMLRVVQNEADFSSEFYEDEAIGSIQEFRGLEFKPVRRPPSPVYGLECARATSSAPNDSIFDVKPNVTGAEMTVLQDNDNYTFNATVQEDQTIMTDGGRANQSSLEYEKDEKIQRLLLENSLLKDRLTISKGRAEQSMIFEERNRTLELEKNVLQQRLDRTFGEMEVMRVGQTKGYYNVDSLKSDKNDSPSQHLKFIDRINKLLIENNRLEKDFEAATSKASKIARELKECERRNGHLEDSFSGQIAKYTQLTKIKDEIEFELETKNVEIETLKNTISELEKKVEEDAHETTIKPVPTDAGNSTQIIHMAANPIDAAHAEFQAAESRKRKITDSGEENEAKRVREEIVSELEERISLLEREKNILNDTMKLQKDLAGKFRQVCIALTGLQIKIKDSDEGICSVKSEYEEATDAEFIFKCFYGTTRIDMLDVGSSSSNQMYRKWEPLMKKYIGDRNSIPAFLAAMTLQLERERDFDETMHERTHTFSVLHED